ncbi:hypothetical protein PRIPAC_86217 [Pristionchus pacificus]|uniref:Uncharacterized protein n=1 Tax=Pristionchus pacificus TaxID=54126 RepID=A0A2A6BUQ1_PRIPA|nr:hypothetical protein PRIPAC_86217 [Pristionchus pacificus]|eukprot:PDM69587.1 hypothetical protein PRIPAC_44683 [Pristionchus pacificus]
MSVDRNHNILDHGKDKTELLQKELLWIRALNTAYPFETINNKLRLRQHDYVQIKSLTKKVSELHRDFVVTMVDKASGNYAFTCKKLYLQFMEKELNTQSDDGKTYEIKDQLDPVSIKLNHEKFTRSFGIAVRGHTEDSGLHKEGFPPPLALLRKSGRH